MGSIEAACISGFLCRLCSEMHRTVIHIYGDQGQKHGLAKKINDYLPVTITPNDPLPKTICETCMLRVEQHHDLMLKVARPRSCFQSSSTPRALIVRPATVAPTPSSDESISENSDENSDSSTSSSGLVSNERETENVVVCNNLYSSDISNSNSNDTTTTTNL